MKAKEIVTYEAFGAKGDGRTDDLASIVAAHAYANAHGLSVRAKDAATYYLGGKDLTAVIQTDTDFGTARFVIDDRELENHRAFVFEVQSKLPSFVVEGIETLQKGQPRLNLTLPQPALLIAVNDGKRQFIRRGLNVNNGSPQTDVFVVTPSGEVDPLTPILWDFDRVTELTAYPIDETPLLISGGRFTTIANDHESEYTYHARGILIQRSNVQVEGIEHRITGEGDHGAPYRAFLAISHCVDVTVRNSGFSGRKTYQTIGNAGQPVSMGSYGLHINHSHNVLFENCVQLNDIHDRSLWGIMASNFSKNLTYDGCTLSRFDAHQGVYNATIVDSEIGHSGINLIGSGTFLLENSKVNSSKLIDLRSDYGSTWEGELVIRDSTFVPLGNGPVRLILGSNDGRHDFGYDCHMPERIVLDGLTIRDGNRSADIEAPVVLGNFNRDFKDESYQETYAYKKTREILLKNVITESGLPLKLSANPVMFSGVKLSRPDEYQLVWTDEFEQDGPPDPKKWTFEQGFVRNRELQWYQPENAFCKDGRLVIEARREQRPNPDFVKGSDNWKQNREMAEYTSACLMTKGLHSWQYGRFEIKARIQAEPGLWPAIWFLGVEGQWPSNGEIDLMEFYRGKILANACWGTEKAYEAKWDSASIPLEEFGDPEWDQKFHIWRMEWDPDHIRLYMDDRLLNTIDLTETINPNTDLGPKNPFHQPHYLLLNLAIGGNSGGDPSHTDFPSRYEIEYVRVYQKIITGAGE